MTQACLVGHSKERVQDTAGRIASTGGGRESWYNRDWCRASKIQHAATPRRFMSGRSAGRQESCKRPNRGCKDKHCPNGTVARGLCLRLGVRVILSVLLAVRKRVGRVLGK